MTSLDPTKYPPALGLIELSSIVRGVVVSDAMVKRAPVELWDAYPVSRGRFLIFIKGGVAEVSESMEAGLECAQEMTVDSLFLPQAHQAIHYGMDGEYSKPRVDALALLECTQVAATLLAVDAGLKAADVQLVRLHLAKGISGKAYFMLAGPLHEAEAALDAATDIISMSVIVSREIIPAAHQDMTLRILGLESLQRNY